MASAPSILVPESEMQHPQTPPRETAVKSPRTPNTRDIDPQPLSETAPVRSHAPRKRKRRDWRAVALDNDETTGNWGRASLMYRLWKKMTGCQPPVADFVSEYLAKGGARPGCKELLRELAQLRAEGSLDEVVIFTGASDFDGWVSFLKQCLEAYAGTPGLFGRVISSTPNSPRRGGRIIKDLSLVSPDAESVVLVDDKPEFAWKGYVIGVAEYKAHVPVQALVKKLHAASVKAGTDSKKVASYLLRVLKRDFDMFPRDPRDFSSDRWLHQVTLVVRNMFVKTESVECQACSSCCDADGQLPVFEKYLYGDAFKRRKAAHCTECDMSTKSAHVTCDSANVLAG